MQQAGEDLPECRFSGAVLPHQGMDLAPLEGEVHVVQGDRAAERLADILKLNETHFHS